MDLMDSLGGSFPRPKIIINLVSTCIFHSCSPPLPPFSPRNGSRVQLHWDDRKLVLGLHQHHFSGSVATGSHFELQIGYRVSALEQVFHPATTRLLIPEGSSHEARATRYMLRVIRDDRQRRSVVDQRTVRSSASDRSR
jgi:hypothetical protein